MQSLKIYPALGVQALNPTGCRVEEDSLKNGPSWVLKAPTQNKESKTGARN